MNKISDADRLEFFVKGSIVGHLIGDSLGYLFNSESVILNNIDFTEGPGGEFPGEYTVHGALSVATMASLNECEELDLEDMMEKFQDVYIGGYMTSDENCYDVGLSTSQSINNYLNGMTIDQCGQLDDINDADALSRMLPVALYFCTHPIETIIDSAHKMCTLTHKHHRSQVACAAYCLMMRNLLLQKAEKVFDTLISYYHERDFFDHLQAAQNLKDWASRNDCSGNTVEDCFWVSWNSFSKYEGDFQFAITKAIQDGYDKNATGALTGSFSAIMNGLNNIPANWLRTIRLTSEVMEAVTKFTDAVVKRILK